MVNRKKPKDFCGEGGAAERASLSGGFQPESERSAACGDAVRIAVLVSGGGTNLQAILDAQAGGRLKSGRAALVVSSSAKAYALERAATAGVPSEVITEKAGFDAALLRVLEQYNIEVVALAGFLRILGKRVIEKFPNRIINVHPSLIPAFCGDGLYGLKVHEAALAKGVKVTGATVHLVNEITDGGKILLQKAVDVREGDTPETLQRRVMLEAEHVLLPRALEEICKNVEFGRN
jgi:phosphoribosylglycinamide formyltransferase-1